MTAPKRDQAADWQNRIVCDPEILSGKPTIKGTAISVALVKKLLSDGLTPAIIIRDYLAITAEDVAACRRHEEARGPHHGEKTDVVKIEKRTPERVADWRDRIVCDPAILVGKPTIKGTRISVELVTDLLEGGRTASDIVRRYPHIREEDVDACARYKTTGAKLSNVTWADIDAIMDGTYQPRT